MLVCSTSPAWWLCPAQSGQPYKKQPAVFGEFHTEDNDCEEFEGKKKSAGMFLMYITFGV